MKTLKLSVSPHIHSGRSTAGIMRDVLISLLPATIAGVVIFGLSSLSVIAACVISCVGLEFLYNILLHREQTVSDLSAAVTGLLLALNLPASTPIWQCVVGSLFAIIVVKALFGGIGYNLVNPAITARVFMLVAFGSMAVPAFPAIADTASSATPLSSEIQGTGATLTDLFLGNIGGAIGETCKAALLLGFVYLLVRRVITWHLPVAYIGSVFLCSLCYRSFDLEAALALTLSGGLFIGAIFMATDYVTSPATSKGKIVFGIGAGLITFLIRHFGVYPEGVSFAILTMNILTPYIDELTKYKVLGKGGKAV